MRIGGYRLRVLVSTLVGFLVLASCEDTLTTQIDELVSIAQLPEYSLTVQAPANGTATPVGEQIVKEAIPISVSVTPDTGYTFLYWEKVSGPGLVVFADENVAATTVSVSGGSAVIAAYVGSTPRNLTVSASGSGTVSPSGQIVVQDGAARNITATPDSSAHEFVRWQKTSGDGAVVFGSETSASTTVAVTGGDAAIEGSFALKSYTITVTATTGGSTSAASILLDHGVQSSTISATADSGYVFAGWSISSGTGVSFSPNASAGSVTVTATGGDATIQANFAPTHSLVIASQTGGYTSPSGTRTVTSGVATPVTAYPRSTYVFDGWVQTSGSGTATFSNSSATTTNVTVTGGNAAIRANFRKETVTLSELGSYQHSDTTTNPSSAESIYLHGGSLFVAGPSGSQSGSNLGVVRRFNVSTPTVPTSGNGDYDYLGSVARAIIGNGTYFFVGTDSALYRYAISGFSSFSTPTSIAHGIRDLSLVSSSSFLGVRTNGYIAGYTTSLGSGNMISDSSWGFDYVTAIPGGLGAIMQNNGAHQLGTYTAVIQGTQGVTSPDDAVLLHNGFDMDPGWAGKGVQDVDGEYLIIPVQDWDGTNSVKFYDVTNRSSIYPDGNAVLSRRANALATDTSGSNDYYVFAAAGTGSGATIYVVDMYSKSSPVVRTTFNISGYGSATAIAAVDDRLYVVLEDPTSGTNPKPTIMVLQITKS